MFYRVLQRICGVIKVNLLWFYLFLHSFHWIYQIYEILMGSFMLYYLTKYYIHSIIQQVIWLYCKQSIISDVSANIY